MFTIGSLATSAAADDASRSSFCGRSGRPWVRLEVPEPERAPDGFAEIIKHVRAELGLRKIEVCTVTNANAAIATVFLTSTSRDAVEVTIDVHDSITQKRVSRVLDLRTLPKDARPLAIAVGTDELLRASWIEIRMKTARPRRKPPEAVENVVEAELRPAPIVEAGTALTFESYKGGQKFWGIDLRGGVRPLYRLTATLRLGLRQGLSAAAPNGSVRATALLLGLGAKLSISNESAPIGVELLGRLDAARVSFLPEANAGALAHPSDATAVVAAGGLAVWLALSPAIRVLAEGSLGAPLRPVRATDTGSEVTAVEGLGLMTGVEVAALF